MKNHKVEVVYLKKNPYFFDKERNPISLNEWSILFKDDNYRKIAEDTIGKYKVLTLWIGYSHASPPLIFETMIHCKDKKDILHSFSEYWVCLEFAMWGHQLAIKRVKENGIF